MKKFLNEFKEFAIRGNVVDMAVGVIIGGAFGKIVTSLVEDIVMPVISIILGTVNLAELSITVEPLNPASNPIEIKYGLFLQNIFNFLIIAFCIFIAVKLINAARRKLEAKPEEAEEAPKEEIITRQEELLAEIRDILKKGR